MDPIEPDFRSPLRDRTYRHLFFAQVIALGGTGLATVALGLLAYELSGPEAGAVLGVALAIKMVAYVTLAPLVGAFASLFPRRGFLVVLDLARAALVLFLPFVTEVWQVYVLIALLQSCSAAFTPTFQATIPDVVPDEDRYTRALSLSRLAYDLESLLSPVLAAVLLTFVSFDALFVGTAIAFLLSSILVRSVALPDHEQAVEQGSKRLTRGIRIYTGTPRLRGLLALHLAVAAGGAMVIVNTVVYVRDVLRFGDREVAIALAASGAGSMLVAFTLPKVLDRVGERTVMLVGSAVLAVGLLLGLTEPSFAFLLPIWFLLGMGSSAIQTPTGRVLRRSANSENLAAVFATHFSFSHACWLATYLVAGTVGARIGVSAAFGTLAVLVIVGAWAALALWPTVDEARLTHVHEGLPPDHPHLLEGDDVEPLSEGGVRHTHDYMIDDCHGKWPAR